LASATACGGSDGKKSSAAGPEDSPVSVGEFLHEAAEECDDGKDNDEDEFVDCDDLDCRAESESCDFAPELDRTLPTALRESTKFLYTGPDPVQKELDEEALDLRRLAVIHGRVVDAEGEPLRMCSSASRTTRTWASA
jgi:hypothetical protein